MRRGFSFAEVLFAVMILGVGFIMVAAIFPVAIKQTALTGEESIASAIAREATGTLTSLNNSNLMPPTVPGPGFPTTAVPGQRAVGEVWSFHDTNDNFSNPFDRIPGAPNATHAYNWLNPPPAGVTPSAQADFMWGAIRGNLILPFDRRFAWVAMYRRDGTWAGSASAGITGVIPDPFAQVIVIGVQVRNRSAYDTTIDTQHVAGVTEPATLEPKLLHVSLFIATDGVPCVQFLDGYPQARRAAEGAFIVVSDDNIMNMGPPFNQFAGFYNGHVYRVGNYRTDASGGTPQPIYELAPGYDAFPGPGAPLNPANGQPIVPSSAAVYIVGRNYAPTTGSSAGMPPANPAQLQFEGIAQDVAIYTTYMRVN